MRGTHRASRQARPCRRFIPACAGNSAFARSGGKCEAVHPRVCGELGARHLPGSRMNGSSPRVRGTQGFARGRRRRERFIPACAGNSRPDLHEHVLRSVHPRVCGELALQLRLRGYRNGSSPRVRGTQAIISFSSSRRRFIPACAGNSGDEKIGPLMNAVHPRVCGELGLRPRAREPLSGSSPRVRGTPLAECRIARRRRFIPACAGNSEEAISISEFEAVHPRVCGELVLRRGLRGWPVGSSPRVRGTLVRGEDQAAVARFIPACAGNSPHFRRDADRRSVHPRVCGELI